MALSYELEVGLLQPHLFSRNAFFFPTKLAKRKCIPSLHKLRPCKACSTNHPSQLHCNDPNAKHQHQHAHCSMFGVLRLQHVHEMLAKYPNVGSHCCWTVQRNTRIFFRQKFGKNFCRNLIRTKRCCRSAVAATVSSTAPR